MRLFACYIIPTPAAFVMFERMNFKPLDSAQEMLLQAVNQVRGPQHPHELPACYRRVPYWPGLDAPRRRRRAAAPHHPQAAQAQAPHPRTPPSAASTCASRSPPDTIMEIFRATGELPAIWRSVRFDDDGVPVGPHTAEHDETEGPEGDLFDLCPLEEPLLDRILRNRDPRAGACSAASRKRLHNGEFKDSDSLPLQVDGASVPDPDPSKWLWTPPPSPGTIFVGKENGELAGTKDEQAKARLESETHPISREEGLSLHDLLAKISVYEPLKRSRVEEVLCHEWFKWIWQLMHSIMLRICV